MKQNFILIIFVLFGFISCNKDSENLDKKELEKDLNEILILTTHENELAKLAIEGKISERELNEIATFFISSEKNKFNNQIDINNFKEDDFFSYLREKHPNTKLEQYFKIVLFSSKNFLIKHEKTLLNIQTDEFKLITKNTIEVNKNYGVVESRNNWDEEPADEYGGGNPVCAKCTYDYNTCMGQNGIIAGGVVAGGYTIAAGMATYSGGTLTPAAGGVFVTSVVTAGVGYAFGWWSCSYERDRCKQYYKC